MAIEKISREANRQTQVSQEMNTLRERISILADAVNSLFDRFERVLSPAPKTPGKEKEAPLQQIVPLADNIRDARMQIDAIIERAEELRSSCEL